MFLFDLAHCSTVLQHADGIGIQLPSCKALKAGIFVSFFGREPGLGSEMSSSPKGIIKA